MYTLDEYLTDEEADAARAYLSAYCAEYDRVWQAGCAGDRERLMYWSELAHQAGKAARERSLAAALPKVE